MRIPTHNEPLSPVADDPPDPVVSLVNYIRHFAGSVWLNHRRSKPTEIIIPTFPLTKGWNKETTRVRFELPGHFPWQQPDRFHTDHDLRWGGGVVPQRTWYENTKELTFLLRIDTSTSPGREVHFVNAVRRRLQSEQSFYRLG